MMQYWLLLLALFGNLFLCALSVAENDPVDKSTYPCSAKGFRNDTTGNCVCINGYFGFKCQNKYCPHGPSWHSIPKVSHVRNVERVACSNAGDCDYSTGTCRCRPGYDGRACERTACPTRPMLRVAAQISATYDLVYDDPDSSFTTLPNPIKAPVLVGGSGAPDTLPPFMSNLQDSVLMEAGKIPGLDPPCSGHGRCRTMGEAAAMFDGYSLVNPPISYTSWESDRIQGCLCDPGWDGFDCSLRKCPWGRDPEDPLLNTYKNAVFTIECKATAGYFAIDIMGGHTAPIPYDADPMFLKRVLEGVVGVGPVDVVMQEDVGGLPNMCGSASTLATTFTLRNHPGQLPPVRLTTSLASSRFFADSGTVLSFSGGSRVIRMVTKYTLICGACNGCHGNVNFAYGNSISANVDIITSGAAAAIRSAILGIADLSAAGWTGLDVSVSIPSGASDAICYSSSNVVVISLYSAYGNINGLTLIDGSFSESAVYVQKGFGGSSMGLQWSTSGGDGDVYECSNQGECDRSTGVCRCFHVEQEDLTVHRSAASDGFGGPGYLGDCGRIVTNLGCNHFLNSTTPVCSGHGICANNKCQCMPSYSGLDCKIRSCPKGPAWFDEPVTPTRAHALAECSGQGYCDQNTGKCTCRDGFTGAACGIKDCPADDSTGEYCSGHGYCQSVRDIFKLYGLDYGLSHSQDLNNPATWDGNMMRECLCAAKYSAGEFAHPLKSPTDPKDWVGRYAVGKRPLPGWTGYACHQRLCPRGDSRMTENSLRTSMVVKEIQRVKCTLTSGSYTLTLFGQTTPAIAYNANAATIKRTVEFVNVIGNVTVTIEHSSATACNPAQTTGVGVLIQFDTEGGNLALATVTSSTGSGVSIEAQQDGTSENLECGGPNVGICDRDMGVCICNDGRFSSDGSGKLGANGDCGYWPYYNGA